MKYFFKWYQFTVPTVQPDLGKSMNCRVLKSKTLRHRLITHVHTYLFPLATATSLTSNSHDYKMCPLLSS